MVRLEESFFDNKTSRLSAVWRMYKPCGQNLEYVGSIRFDNRLYTASRLMELACSVGWENSRVYGGLDKAVFKEDPKKAILVAW